MESSELDRFDITSNFLSAMNTSLLQKNAEVFHPAEETRDKARSKMTRRFAAHQCVNFLVHVDIDGLARMIVRRLKPWAIIAIATFILVASVSVSGSTEFSKPPAITGHSALPDHVGNTNADFILRNSLVPSRNYFMKNYKRFVEKNNPEPRTIRYKRYVEFSETRLPNASDSATIGRPANATNKGTLTRVPLYKTHSPIVTRENPQTMKMAHDKVPISSIFQAHDRAREKRALSQSYRTRRSLTAGNIYSPQRNASDYYTERMAVMAKFYARQREIEARYSNRTNFSLNAENVTPPNEPVTSNVTLFRLYPARNSTFTDNRVIFHHPSITIDPYSNRGIKLDGRPILQEVDRRFGSHTWNNRKVEDQVVWNYTTPIPCADASLSGTFPPKKRSKITGMDSSGERDIQTTSRESNGSDHETWGECKGKVVYQHNLLLGLKGPSTLNTMFEVIIQGPMCITCVETLRYNETRAKVRLDSGGRGYNYVKLKLQGYENEGFSYIIKVWAVRKIGLDCSNI